MTGFQIKNNAQYVDNFALADIAKEYGTPCYVYSASVIRKQYEILKNAFEAVLPKDRQPLLCYACKANTSSAILKLLSTLGCGLEIVSEGELYRGLKAGFSGNKVITTSFGKTDSEIKTCLDTDILQFNIESPKELDHVNEVAAQKGKCPDVVFRLNPNISGGGHHKISTGRKRDKFGNSAERILELYERAANMENVNPVGIAMHIGSQVFQIEKFKPGFEAMAALVQKLRSKGFTVNVTDIGGGFPIVYKDENLPDFKEYAGWVNDIIVPLETNIQMEPGRYMVGNAGVLLAETLYVKETQDRDFLVLDAGMNDLIRPTLYEAYHKIGPVQNLNRPSKNYDVVGPICESGDIFGANREMPQVNDHDIVAIQSAGAYGFMMASNYNSRPFPAEIMVDGDNIALIRQRQSLDDIIKGEQIPKWMA